MNIDKYLASGVIEAYWAGELSDEEMQEVDELAAEFPEISAAMDEMREAIIQFGKDTHNLPNRDVLKRVETQISHTEKESLLKVLAETKEEPAYKPLNMINVWSIAATILLIFSVSFNYIIYQKARNVQNQLQALNIENTQLAQRVNQNKEELQFAELRMAHFLNEDNIHIHMAGLAVAPDAAADVFWNRISNDVFISIDDLPEPPHGHQYQLWAIKPGQAPIDAGVFEHNKKVQQLKVIKGNVQAFAVTLEKEGGSPVATVDQTFVKGFLKKS